jgi:hypothetical protein
MKKNLRTQLTSQRNSSTLIALKMKKEIRHRPTTWMKMTGIIVLDPDGWRCDNKNMNTPLTEEEWKWRQQKSTCMVKKKHNYEFLYT